MRQLYSQSAVNVVKKLFSDINSGLNSSQVEKMRETYGENIILKPEIRSFIKIIFFEMRQIWSLASILTCILLIYMNMYIALYFITAILGISLFIYTSLEYKEEKKLKSIDALNSSKVNVIRDGVTVLVNSEEIVVGDIIYIEEGKYIPADIRLIECNGLKINELAVTGEGYEVEKYSAKIEDSITELSEIKNMAFKSTVVKEGNGVGIVTAVGMNTQIGNIVSVLNNYKNDSQNLIGKIRSTVNRFSLAACILAFLVSCIYLIIGFDLNNWIHSLIDVFMIAIPMQSIIFVFLSLFLYSKKLNRKGIYLKNFSSIELISRINLLFSKNVGVYSNEEMILNKLYANGKTFNVFGGEKINGIVDEEENELNEMNIEIKTNSTLSRLFHTALLCNDSRFSREKNESKGDKLEIGLIKFAQRNHIYKSELDKEFPRVLEVPYDSDKRIKTTVNKVDEKFRANCVGAVDSILSRCTHVLRNGVEMEISGEEIEKIKEAAYNMSSNSLKVIAVACRNFSYMPSRDENIESNLVFVGIMGIINPLKLEAYDAVSFCMRNGIRTIIDMNDNKITASAIGNELKLLRKGETALAGLEIDFMEEDEFNKAVDKKNVYSMIKPKHKVKIIDALKKRKYTIASIGSKLTDLPFMSISNLSIAAGNNCSGIIKSLSDVFINQIDIVKLLRLLKESRQMINSLKNVVSYLVTSCTSCCGFLLLSLIFNGYMPLNIYQIMWINVVTISLSIITLMNRYKYLYNNFNVNIENDELHNKSLFNKINLNNSIIKGLVISIISYLGFRYALNENVKTAQTIAFSVLAIGDILFLFNYTEEGIFFNDVISNLLMLLNLLLLGLILFFPMKIKILDLHYLNRSHWEIIAILSALNLLQIFILKNLKNKKEIEEF